MSDDKYAYNPNPCAEAVPVSFVEKWDAQHPYTAEVLRQQRLVVEAINTRTLTKPSLSFSTSYGRTVMTITPEGQLVPGEHLSDDEVSRGVFNVMANLWPHFVAQWASEQGWVKP